MQRPVEVGSGFMTASAAIFWRCALVIEAAPNNSRLQLPQVLELLAGFHIRVELIDDAGSVGDRVFHIGDQSIVFGAAELRKLERLLRLVEDE